MTRTHFMHTKLGVYVRHTSKATRNKRQILKLTEYAVTDDFGNLQSVKLCQTQVSAATTSFYQQ